MKIETTRFGEIDVPEETIVTITDGILGFPDQHRFVLLEHDAEGTPFKWLQCCEDPNLAFIVMDPALVVENYVVECDDDTAERMGASDENDEFATMAIVNIPRDNPIAMTVNLRAPIIVNLTSRTGWQVVLPNEDYPIRHRLFPDPEPAGR